MPCNYIRTAPNWQARDPYELEDVSAANPQLVASLTADLEAEFGGVGSLAAIDKFQMEENFRLFTAFFSDRLSPSALLGTFHDAPPPDTISV